MSSLAVIVIVFAGYYI